MLRILTYIKLIKFYFLLRHQNGVFFWDFSLILWILWILDHPPGQIYNSSTDTLRLSPKKWMFIWKKFMLFWKNANKPPLRPLRTRWDQVRNALHIINHLLRCTWCHHTGSLFSPVLSIGEKKNQIKFEKFCSLLIIKLCSVVDSLY